MPSSHAKSGSVLLVTLLMISLLLLITVTFTALVRQEYRSVQNRVEHAQAQAYAKVSMHLALNKVQCLSGPDRRVSAHADILGTRNRLPETQWWTGIWAQNHEGILQPRPEWLVSGKDPDPSRLPSQSSVQLFPAIHPYAAVKVPLETHRIHRNGRTRMQLAYWVADEASKASLKARRDALALYCGPLAEKRSLVESQCNFGISLQPFFEQSQNDLRSPELAFELGRITELEQLLFAVDSASRPFLAAGQTLPKHELTLRARGVFENCIDGGLKRNLSDFQYRDSFLVNEDVMRFLAPKQGALPVESISPLALGYEAGDPFFSPRPLLTEAVLYIGLFHTWSDARVRIRFHLQAEFWNPYSLPLRFADDQSRRWDRALTLHVENLPTVEVKDLSGRAPTLLENLNQFSSYAPEDPRSSIHSWLEIKADSLPKHPELLPGEVYQVMEPNPASQAQGLARNFTDTRWSGSHATRPEDSALIQISAIHPPQGLRLRLLPYGTPRSVLTGMQEIRGLVFQDFQIHKRFNSGPNPFSRTTSSSYVLDDYNFAYHFRIASDAWEAESLNQYLLYANCMDPLFDSRESFQYGEHAPTSYAELLDPVSTYPPDVVSDSLNLFNGLDQFHDASPRSHAAPSRKMLLIDVPDGDVFSIGQLSSLPIYQRPARIIGSPQGGELNAVYDRYYLSPKQLHPETNHPIALHPAVHRRKTCRHPAASDDAIEELSDGQFNINSTSIAAWEAMLRAPMLTAKADSPASSPSITREGCFHPLPFFQQQQQAFVLSREELAQPDQRYAQGIRVIQNTKQQPMLRRLAEELVQKLKTRGRPFQSIQELANSGMLQEAIDAVNAQSPDPGINEGIPRSSPLALSQQDLLHTLAPVAAPRSDSFLIRALGRKSNPDGTGYTEALCEARVQRIPEKLDQSDPMSPAQNLHSSRRYEIVSFRWLPVPQP